MTYSLSSRRRTALSLGLCVILGAPLLLGGLLLQQLRQAEESDQLVKHTLDILAEVERLRDAVMSAESLQRLYLLTGREAHEGEYRRMAESIPVMTPQVQEMILDDRAKEKLDAVLVTLNERLALLEANAQESPRLAPEILRERLVTGHTKSAQLERELRDLAAIEGQLLTRRMEEQHARATAFQRLTLGTLGTGFVVLCGMVWLLLREGRERRLYEGRIADARDAALDAVKTTSAFVASVSHEIRTPMNGVLGTADLLLRDPLLSARQREGLETIRTSGRALLEIINDILDLSKLQAGEMVFVREPLSPSGVIDSVITLFAQPAAAKGLELTAHISPDLPEQVLGDALRLRQVLSNLVSNAVKFTENGGVSIHVVRRREMESDGQICLRFDVCDTGPGIAKEAQQRLFQPFAQVDQQLSRRHGGTGLGLAVSRELVQRMNGAMGVESSPGKGATFWFTAVFGASQQTAPVRSLGRRALVVIEDRPMTAESLRAHAAAWKLNPLVYTTEGDVPVIQPVTEEALPETGAVVLGSSKAQDWLDLVKRLRGREWLKDTPIFLLTDGEIPSRGEMTEVGISGILHYPFRPSELYDQLAGGGGEGLDEPSATELSEPALRPATLIVADDNPVNQRVLSNQLEFLGLTPVLCSDGQQALEKVQAGAGEVVLMDVQMPVMDGLEATRAIRAWEKAVGRPPIPIIAVTAHVMSGDAEGCLQAGMDGYLPKPVELNRLQQVLQRWLGTTANTGTTGSPATAAVAAVDAEIDDAQLQSCLTGEAELDADLVTMAFQQGREMQERLAEALAEGSDAGWRQAAHRGRGSAATMGFRRLAQLFQRAEFEATSPEARARVLDELRAATTDLASALRDRGHTLPA